VVLKKAWPLAVHKAITYIVVVEPLGFVSLQTSDGNKSLDFGAERDPVVA
jgi:hypothetical protein